MTDEVAGQTRRVAVDPDYTGPARVASYTVAYEGDAPSRGLLICEAPGGRRAIAVARDADLIAQLLTSEGCGRGVRIDPSGVASS